MTLTEQEKQSNWLVRWWRNIKGTKKNWKKIKSSPYASLNLALKARKLIIGILIPYLLYMTYKMVVNMRTAGFMGIFTKLISIGIMGYICWKIYRTIPQAKKQMEYYKKYPHLINYCPTDTKQTVDDILKKIEENKIKLPEENKNGTIPKESTTNSATSSDRSKGS